MGGWTKEYEKLVRSIDTIARVRRRFHEADELRLALTPHVAAPPVVVTRDSVHAGDAVAWPPAARAPMLHAALDAYAEAVSEGPGADSYKKGISDSIEALKHYRGDSPIDAVDYAALKSLANYIRAAHRRAK